MINSKFLTVVFLIILIFYGNTLTNGFVHDDIWQIQSNQYIKDIQNLPKIFTTCIAEDLLGGCKGIGFYYRPLQSFFYLLTYQISHEPWIFHLGNLVFLAVAAVLVYKLFKLLKIKELFALVGAVIFVTHPVNSEVINWVSATPELLMTILMLITVITFIKFIQSKKKKIIYLGLSASFFFLSLLSKETALFLLLLLPAYVHLEGGKNRITPSRWRIFIPYLLIIGLYLAIREEVLGRVIYRYEGFYSLDGVSQILTALSLYPKYLLKLIYPLPLSFQGIVLPVRTFNIEVLFGAFVFSAALLSIVLAIKKNLRLAAFGILIILISIAPALLFVNKLGEYLLSERYLFFSSIGFALIITDIVCYMAVKLKKTNFKKYKLPRNLETLLRLHPRSGSPWFWRSGYKYFFAGILVLYFSTSWWNVFQRNKDWKDNISSYQAMIRIDPTHKKAHYQLGQIYKDRGEIELARSYYKNALGVDPNYLEAKQALGNISNYYSKDGLAFYYPKGWLVKEDDKTILISDKNNNFKAELIRDQLKSQPELGVLINQGLAQLPNFDKASVKIWSSDGMKKIQFFLSKDGKTAEVIAYPADSAQMKQFDGILGTLKID